MPYREVSAREARRVAKAHGVKLPRVGYQMSLGNRRWITSTGHAQFGWFESRARYPYAIECHCDTCPSTCPNYRTEP